MPTKQQELGKKVAISLIKEMHFLGKLKNNSNLNELLDGVPERKNLDFQIIEGIDAAKSSLAKGNFGAELAGLRFCIADGEVENIKMMDVDHTVPFTYIRNKQIALLNYLNDLSNVDFAEEFLKTSATVDLGAIHISDYFRRDPKNGIIKGTRRFFRLCYNDIDNLLLLCQACNIQKGAQESLEWFVQREPFLGSRFVQAVTEAGGLHDGIIVKKVCKGAFDSSNIIKIGHFDCRIHDGAGKGLGEFVDDWFENENPGYAQDVVEAYKNIWLELKEIYELQLKFKASDDEQRREETRSASIKLTSMIEAQIKVVEERYQLVTKSEVAIFSQSSHSSGDDSLDQKSRIEEVNHKIRQVLNYMHGLKKIQVIIAQNDYDLATRENKIELYSYYKTLGIRELDFDKQEKFFNDTVATLKQKYSEGGKFSVDGIKQIIKEVAKKYSFKLQLEEAIHSKEETDEINAHLQAENQELKRKIAELEAEDRSVAQNPKSSVRPRP